jgi:hypothetical protein
MMDSDRRTTIVVGALFVVATVASIPSFRTDEPE